jgi:hypothetical protein
MEDEDLSEYVQLYEARKQLTAKIAGHLKDVSGLE